MRTGIQSARLVFRSSVFSLCGLLFACPGTNSHGAPLAQPDAPLEDNPHYLYSEYTVESWQTEQGLPDNYVNVIRQTPDGYLWIATFNGLARFNGVEFVVFDAGNTPELPSSRITSLDVDGKGRLWIRTEYGQLTMWEKGRFRKFGERDGIPGRGIATLIEDRAGEIWIGPAWNSTNYYRFVGSEFKPVSGTNTFLHCFGRYPDVDGYRWGFRSNILFSAHPENPVAAVIPDWPASGSRLAASKDGGMWMIGTRVRKFYPPRGSGATTQERWKDYGALPKATVLIGGYLEDRSGNLWLGTGTGEIWRLDTNGVWRRFKLLDSTATELGRCLFEDAEANLWIGTGGSGLVRIKPVALKTYYARDGLASDVVRSVTQDRDGNVWLATVDRVDCFPEVGRAVPSAPLKAHHPLKGPVLPWSVHGDRSGALWVGEFASGVYRFRDGERESFGLTSSGRAVSSNVIFEDHQGQMHFGTPYGLYHIEGKSFVPQPNQPEGSADIRTIAEDRSGRLCLGLNGGGLLRKGNEGWERFTIDHGLPGNHVWALYVDAEDTMWIGVHGRGLSRFRNGKFFNFGDAELPRLITCILEDDIGHLWFGSNRGLFRAERKQLNEFADGRIASVDVTHYDRADGMGSSQCTSDRQPTACKARDGKLWFATMKGITVVDPGSLPFNSRPPPVAVEVVLIDDQPVPPNSHQVKVPASADRLEFRYAGLSFAAPDRVRFRYRLEGFDKDWVNANNRRTAYYTKVPAGTYRFEVAACNNNNVWNNTGASMSVIVMPDFWQTAWFQALALFSAGGFAFGLYELRVLRLKRQRLAHETFSRRLLESQESERKRIAAELHDGLGQSLLVVKNYAFMALKDTATPGKVREQLQEISESASASIEEVRSIARALRPYQLDRFGLTKTLEDAADLLAKSGSLQINTAIDNVDDLFSSDAEISIYRVVQEWLNNVVKHAQAATARLTVRKDAEWVRIILEDDGIGFDYATLMNQSGGKTTFGLANLRERIRLLGGTLKVESAPGKGTRLCVEIPCKE